MNVDSFNLSWPCMNRIDRSIHARFLFLIFMILSTEDPHFSFHRLNQITSTRQVSDHFPLPAILYHLNYQQPFTQTHTLSLPESDATHRSWKYLQRILKSNPWRPFVINRVGSPRPKRPNNPSFATISLAAVTVRPVNICSLGNFQHCPRHKTLTIPYVTLVDLAVGLDDSKRVTSGVGDDRSCETDECLALREVSIANEHEFSSADSHSELAYGKFLNDSMRRR